jgi:hypothetical protein
LHRCVDLFGSVAILVDDVGAVVIVEIEGLGRVERALPRADALALINGDVAALSGTHDVASVLVAVNVSSSAEVSPTYSKRRTNAQSSAHV